MNNQSSLLIIWLSTINGVTGNDGYKYGRKCLDHEYLIQSTMIIREKNTKKGREIAENCLSPSEWVRGLLIVEAQSWWLRNHRRPLWIRDVARAPKKVGDYSEKGGRPSQSALLPLVTLYRRLWDVYLVIGPLLLLVSTPLVSTPLGRLPLY